MRYFVTMFVLLFSSVSNVWPETIDLGTDNAANWSVVVGGGGVGTPFLLTSIPRVMEPKAVISITSTGARGGQWVSGASRDTFNGFWYADETFNVPNDATNICFAFSNLQADDHCVLELNGVVLTSICWQHAGKGVMSFPPGPPDVAWRFTGVKEGEIRDGFLIGENDLRLIVCNASGSMDQATRPFTTSGDHTYAGFDATLTYSTPEPKSLVLLITGTVCLAMCGWWRPTAHSVA